MRRVLIISIVIIGILMVSGCVRRWKVEIVNYEAPNWTSDNKIVFMKDHYVQIFEEMPPAIAVHQAGGHEEIYICEIDADGKNYREIAKVVDRDFEVGPLPVNLSTSSSAGEWVVYYIVTDISNITNSPSDGEIWVIKRDGTGLKKISDNGLYPDLSPDGSKIVYQKPNQGIWIMNRDGTNDHQIVADENAHNPAWSSDGGKIGYVRSDSLGIWIVDTSGVLIFSWKGDSIVKPGGPGGIDWGPSDHDAIISECGRLFPEYQDGFIVIYIDSLHYFFTPFKACVYRWSANGTYFIAHDSIGHFVASFKDTFFNVNSDTKWYLKP